MISAVVGASDPEWLPSTIVQSSAALVAIIGGLLVARLVGMSTERGGLSQRLRELDHELETAREHLSGLEQRRINWDLADFLDSAASLYYEDRVREAEQLATQIPVGDDRDERLHFAETFLSYVSEAEPVVKRLFHGEPHARSVDELRDAGLVISPIYEPVVEAMLKSLRPPRSNNPLGFGRDTILPSFSTDEAGRAVTLQRWDTLLHEIDTANRRVDHLERSHSLSANHLASITPQGVIGVLIALMAVVLAGIAFPVIVMAMGWPDLSAPWRISLVVAFLASVTGVGLYIYRLADSMAVTEKSSPSFAARQRLPAASESAITRDSGDTAGAR